MTNLISILAFWKNFIYTCDSIGIYEELAAWLILSFMKISTSLSLEARLSPTMIRATGLPDGKLSSYIEFVNSLLSTNAADKIIARTIKELEFYYPAARIFVALYAKRLFTIEIHCGILDEKQAAAYLGKHPYLPLTKLASYSD